MLEIRSLEGLTGPPGSWARPRAPGATHVHTIRSGVVENQVQYDGNCRVLTVVNSVACTSIAVRAQGCLGPQGGIQKTSTLQERP